MNANTKGRTNAQNGISIISESKGDKPAFLQMNQNGRTPTIARMMAMIRININSGIPSGPMIFDVVLVFSKPIMQLLTAATGNAAPHQ